MSAKLVAKLREINRRDAASPNFLLSDTDVKAITEAADALEALIPRESRTRLVNARMTEDEIAELDRSAKRAGLDRSAFIRSKVLER